MSKLWIPMVLVAACACRAQESGENVFIEAAGPPVGVVLVMTDDQGIGDFGFAGDPLLRTPHLDRLHGESARLTSFYVSPVCAPTRASTMTGRYSFRTRAIDTYIGRAMMEPDEVTIAERLRDAGFATGLFGKWHLGDCYPMRAMDQGFEETLVHRGGGIGQPSDPLGAEGKYTDAVLFRNGECVETEGYCTDVYFDAAIEFVRASRASGRPFLCTITTNAPHGPFGDVPTEWYEHYRQLDLAPANYPQVGHPLPESFDEDRHARIFAMISNIDENVGRLLDALDELGIGDDTLFLFLTDNGPNTNRYTAGLRGMKCEVYEGGIRSPLLARWPARLRAGHEDARPAAHIDLHPTILAACGVEPASELDGRNVLPLLSGDARDWPERSIVIQAHRGDVGVRYHNFALRRGSFKLLSDSGFGKELESVEPRFRLHDLEQDPYEAHDLAAERPELVRELRAEYDRWFDDVSTTREHNFAPPRIVIGSEEASLVHLTRQDWRRESLDSGWARGSMGHWELRAARDVTATIRVHSPPGRQPIAAELSYLRVDDDWIEAASGPVRSLTSREGPLEELVFEVSMAAGNWRLQVVLDDDEGRFGAYQVEIDTRN